MTTAAKKQTQQTNNNKKETFIETFALFLPFHRLLASQLSDLPHYSVVWSLARDCVAVAGPSPPAYQPGLRSTWRDALQW
jgi:hypothetical protein